MKKTISCLLLVIMLLLITACGNQGTKPQEKAGPAQVAEGPIVFKLGHVQTADHPYQKGAEKFKELVEKKSNGKIRVDIFPSSQLGGTREQMEGLQLNTVQFSICSVSQLGTFVPGFMAFTLPYIFRDAEHAEKVTDGEIGKSLVAQLESKKIKNMFFWANGWRHMTNNVRPIKNVEDVKGMKLRVQEAPIFVSFIKSIGAVPSVIPFGELYSALEQKVVDGQENPFAQIATSKLYEVQKYLSFTAHTYDIAIFAMSKTAFDKLPKDLQTVVEDASKEAGLFERQYAKSMESEYLKQLRDNKMQIEENVNLDSFRKAAQAVYKEQEAKIGKDLIEKIINTK